MLPQLDTWAFSSINRNQVWQSWLVGQLDEAEQTLSMSRVLLSDLEGDRDVQFLLPTSWIRSCHITNVMKESFRFAAPNLALTRSFSGTHQTMWSLLDPSNLALNLLQHLRPSHNHAITLLDHFPIINNTLTDFRLKSLLWPAPQSHQNDTTTYSTTSGWGSYCLQYWDSSSS